MESGFNASEARHRTKLAQESMRPLSVEIPIDTSEIEKSIIQSVIDEQLGNIHHTIEKVIIGGSGISNARYVYNEEIDKGALDTYGEVNFTNLMNEAAKRIGESLIEKGFSVDISQARIFDYITRHHQSSSYRFAIVILVAWT